jgi:hypothetical protein
MLVDAAAEIISRLTNLWTWLLVQACVQGRLDSTSAQLEKLRKHLEIARYGVSDKAGQLPPPETVTNDNPAAAKVRHACKR